MSQYVNIRPKGLFTYFNHLSEVEPGALLSASNVNLDRDGILTPRRGIKYYGPEISGISTDRVKQLLQYKNTLLRHLNDKIGYDNGSGTFTDFSGSYLEVVSKERMKSLETKGNLYITTSEGVKKISAKTQTDIASASITNTGAPLAIGGSALPNFSVTGFLPAYSQTPYKTTWLIKDKNGLLVEGVPSDTIVAINDSPTANASVDLTIFIPSEITTDYLFRVYRAQDSATNVALNTTYSLIFEGNPTSAEITAGKIVYNDFATEVFRNAGEALYTNSTAEGILQANYRPPIARDIELFNNFTFYANTKTAHTLTTTMLDVDQIIANTTKFTIAGKNSTYSVLFRGVAEVSSVVCQAKSFYTDKSFFLLNSANNERRYFVWYNVSNNATPPSTTQTLGRIPIMVVIHNISSFTDVGIATAAAIDAEPNQDFTAVSASGVVSISNVYNGYADATANSTDIPTPNNFSTIINGLGEDASLGYVLLSNQDLIQTQVEETAQSLVRVLNQIQKEYTVNYISVTDSTPGLISFQAVDQTDNAFYLTANTAAAAAMFSPALNIEKTNTSIVGNLVTTTTAHNLTTGTSVFLYNVLAGAVNKSGTYKIASTPTANTFTINTSLTGVTTAGYTIDATEGASSNNAAVNSLFFSKENQPESVPLVNQLLIGATDEPILRIKRLRESLFIFKTDGLYRLSGYDTTSFVSQLFDDTAILKCPDSVQTLNNLIFYFGNQGVSQLSEVGNQTISKPIYNQLVPFITSNTNLATATFSLSYESDRSYLLFTVLHNYDTYSTVCYRYNIDSQAWTSWNVSKSCGILKRDNDTLYFGSAIDNVIEQERKAFTRFDFADREIILSLPSSSIFGNIIKPSNFNIVEANDVITQTQYVTIYQFNQLLKKLDLDNGLLGQAFYPTFAISQGDNLTSRMQALVAELNVQDTNHFTDTHGNTSYLFDGSTNFASIQTQYNIIIDRLNQSPTCYLGNYLYSEGTTLHEAIMLIKDTTLKQFTMEKVAPFMQGEILVYKGVKTEIEFVPQHTGDPSTLKQFSNGTFMFEYRSFYSADIGYNSDLSMAYDTVTLTPASYGNFGNFTYGSGAVWGGLGDRVPLRTYIPAKKQRCRFLGARFAHGIALETYAFLGIGLTYNTKSDRAYR